jgi:hypothetical protein
MGSGGAKSERNSGDPTFLVSAARLVAQSFTILPRHFCPRLIPDSGLDLEISLPPAGAHSLLNGPDAAIPRPE